MTQPSILPNATHYRYWRDVSAHLASRKRLREAGLRPGGPAVGWIKTDRGPCYLYDRNQAVPLREASPAQLAALERGRATQVQQRIAAIQAERAAEAAMRQADRDAAAAWARVTLADPQAVILDLETTGLYPGHEIVQIAILAADGTVLLDTLVRPVEPIPPEATAIHGITDAHVAAAPLFPEIYLELRRLLADRTIVTYNAEFDSSLLDGVLARHNLRRWRCRWARAMEWYGEYVGQWSEAHGDYVWQKLPGATHSALGDCQAVLRLLQYMAASA